MPGRSRDRESCLSSLSLSTADPQREATWLRCRVVQRSSTVGIIDGHLSVNDSSEWRLAVVLVGVSSVARHGQKTTLSSMPGHSVCAGSERQSRIACRIRRVHGECVMAQLLSRCIAGTQHCCSVRGLRGVCDPVVGLRQWRLQRVPEAEYLHSRATRLRRRLVENGVESSLCRRFFVLSRSGGVGSSAGRNSSGTSLNGRSDSRAGALTEPSTSSSQALGTQRNG